MGHSKKKLLLSVGFTLLFLGLGILIFSPLLIAKASTPNTNISAHYTGNDGWLTPANARSFLKVDGKIHWVYTKEHDGKRRVAYSCSNDNGKTWSQSKIIAPWADPKNTEQGTPCMITQGDGTLHVFYGEGYPDYGYVFWIYSNDGGKAWSKPFKVSIYKHPWYGPDPGNDSFSPSACVDKNDDIHLICCQGHRIGVIHYFYNNEEKSWTSGEVVFWGRDSGDCSSPSIVVDNKGDIHVLYGLGRWHSWDSLTYIYQKRSGGVWGKWQIITLNMDQPTLLLDDEDTPIISSGGDRCGGSGIYVQDMATGGWKRYSIPILGGGFWKGQATIGSGGKFFFPCCGTWGEPYNQIYQFASSDGGRTWEPIYRITDYNPSTGFNKNRNPITAWSKYNFVPELAPAFFFEKQTPANLKGGPYQLWFVGGDSSQKIITGLSAEPTQFDPYTKGGETTISYVLSRDSSVSIEILDSSGKVVKTKLPRTGEAPGAKGSNMVVWNGVIDFPELNRDTINSDDLSVFLAPDGTYTIKVTAKDKANPSIADTKEIKVKVKTSW